MKVKMFGLVAMVFVFLAVLFPLQNAVTYADDKNVETELSTIFSATGVPAGTCVASGKAFDTHRHLSKYSIEFAISGSGTIAFEGRLNNTGFSSTFFEPESQADLIAGLTATSGPGSDGAGIDEVTIEAGRFLKIYACETGSTNAGTVTAILSLK